MPKDIRSFFGAKPAGKPKAAAPAPKPAAAPEASTPRKREVDLTAASDDDDDGGDDDFVIDERPRKQAKSKAGGARASPKQTPKRSPKQPPKQPAVASPTLNEPMPSPPELAGAPAVTGAEARRAKLDALWHAYFDAPGGFFDNRASKSNERAPDFKQKGTGEALWVRGAPAWARAKLAEAEGGAPQQQRNGGAPPAPTGAPANAAGRPHWMRASDEDMRPPRKGQKPPPPRGRHDALTEMRPARKGEAPSPQPLTFVITGIMESLERDEIEDYIKRHGGQTRSSVSGKTTHLVKGAEPFSEGKLAKAVELKLPIVDEDGVIALVLRAGPPQAEPAPAPAAAPVVAPAARAGGAPGGGRAATGGGGAAGAGGQSAGGAAGELWTDKWAPRELDDLVGGAANAKAIGRWLNEWDMNFNKRKIVPKTSDKNGPKKAVLMSGPPGIGKTSMAKLISKQFGYSVMEVNASDARGKANGDVLKGVGGSTANRVRELVTNRGLSFGKAGMGKTTEGKTLLIMDEVDGMSAGDRGGVADLIKTIGLSKMPIICICNDKYSQKLRSLQGHCMDMTFRRPTKQMVAKRLGHVARAEGLQCDEMALQQLAEECNTDIRLSLNMLQMFARRARVMRFDDVKQQFAAGGKDVDMSIFTIMDQLMGAHAATMTLNQRLDLVFHDADLMPLFVADNYINYMTSKRQDEAFRMERCARAADAVSQSDVIARKVRAEQMWGLMPLQLALGCVEPAALMRGGREAFGQYDFRPRFPAWLGKMSSTNKNTRLLQELNTHMLCTGEYHGTPLSMRMDFVPTLRALLSAPLRDRSMGPEEAVQQVLEKLDSYSLTKDDFDTLMGEFQLARGRKKDALEGVESKTKAALTRQYNAGGHHMKSSVMMKDGVTKGKKRKIKAEANPDRAGDNDVVAMDDAPPDALEEDDEDSDGDAIAGLISKRGKGKGKGKGKAAAKKPKKAKK